jgi:ribose-phosphate pyrophosphokinase
VDDADEKPVLLGFPTYSEPARRLARTAGLAYADVHIHRFPDGESLVRLPERLPAHAIVCCSLDDPNDKLIELELAAASALQLGARRLTLVAPYLCYMRQDTAFHAGEAVSQHIIGRLLARRFDTLITVDPHLHRTHSLQDAVPVRRALTVGAAAAMATWLSRRPTPPLLVGPDQESEQWVCAIAAAAGLDYAVARKTRLGDRDVRVDLPDVELSRRAVVLVDDVASTGHTLAEAARQIRDRKAASISVLVTHALFVDGATALLQAAGVAELYSTDSVVHPSNVIHLDGLLAQALVDGDAT